MVKVYYHSDLKEVQSDGGLAELLSEACQQAPFDRLAWWDGLAEHCGLKPLLAVARGADGSLAALPLSGDTSHLTGMANWYTFRFRPILSNGKAPLEALARALPHRARRITLSGVPQEDGSASQVERAFRRAGWLVQRRSSDINHILSPSGRSFEDYLSTRPGKLRTTLKRKSGKVLTQVFTHFSEEGWEQYESIYAESWKPEEGSPAFLREFARAEGSAGRLRLALAHAAGLPDGPAIAAQLWTVEGGTAFIHKLAHREAAKPLSPGSVLTAALMRHVIDVDRVALVDFGTGDDAYKRDWMEEQRPRYTLDMFRPLNPCNWPILAKIALRSLAPAAKRG